MLQVKPAGIAIEFPGFGLFDKIQLDGFSLCLVVTYIADNKPTPLIDRYRGDIFPILVFGRNDEHGTVVSTCLVNCVQDRLTLIIVDKKITLT